MTDRYKQLCAFLIDARKRLLISREMPKDYEATISTDDVDVIHRTRWSPFDESIGIPEPPRPQKWLGFSLVESQGSSLAVRHGVTKDVFAQEAA